MSRGAAPVDFTQFETLQGSSAMGSANRGRLTNLKTLNVDTSWYFRYRSTQNPDLGASLPQLLNITNQTAIPLNNSYANSTIQAIANVAAIHFAFIEQGGSSLYPILALKATDREVLRILLSIGGVEIDHFSLWHDKMGNTIAQPVAPLSDPVTGLMFPDLNNPANQHSEPVERRPGSRQPDVPDEPDPARAVRVSAAAPPRMFYHPANAFAEWRGDGDGKGFYRRQRFRGTGPGVSGSLHGSGQRGRKRQARRG